MNDYAWVEVSIHPMCRFKRVASRVWKIYLCFNTSYVSVQANSGRNEVKKL